MKVKSEVLAVKLSQEINYAKSLYYEQQLMLRLSENQEQLELDSWNLFLTARVNCKHQSGADGILYLEKVLHGKDINTILVFS